jgi:hypothetical protein
MHVRLFGASTEACGDISVSRSRVKDAQPRATAEAANHPPVCCVVSEGSARTATTGAETNKPNGKKCDICKLGNARRTIANTRAEYESELAREIERQVDCDDRVYVTTLDVRGVTQKKGVGEDGQR